MNHRYNVKLTTMEEDFKAIGLIPENELTESNEFQEVDNPNNPRDIPSPDPSTLGGNVDSSGDSINTKAHHKTGKQPRPRIAPDDKNDHDTAMDGGGDPRKGKSAGGYNKKPNMREGNYETGPDSSHGYSQYQILAKKPGMEKSSSGHYDGGKDPDSAEGLSPTNQHAGMTTNSGKNKKKKMESSSVRRASRLMGEVEALLHGAQTQEDFDHLERGFFLIGENAALLADRLTEISEHFEVEHVVDAMEGLSNSAIEALSIIEMTVSHEAEKKKSIANGKWAAEDRDDDDELSVEDIENLFQAMTLDLMDAVEAYDAVLAEMSKKDDDDDDDDDDEDDKKGKGYKESVSDKLAQLRERRASMGNPTGRGY
jgi:hypothetical protein